MKSVPNGTPGRRRSARKNYHTTRNGNTFKVNRSLADRIRSHRDAKAQRRAAYLSTLPKGRIKRTLYYLHPKRFADYWFNRDGAIRALKIMGISFVAGFILLVGVFAYFRKDLPNLRDISGQNIGGSIRYYDRSGQTLLWEDYDAVKRIPVQSDEIAQDVKDATIAIEDKDFFHHGGFDVRGITRAAYTNVTGGTTSQGGSTITQQLVKLTQDWTQDRSYTRKVKELILSVELERSYTKQEILTGYLNTAPYGGIEYGVEAAARDYFNKPAKDLTLSESTMLAAIPKAPAYYSPYSGDFDKGALVGRQVYILDLMHEQGMITAEERDAAKVVDVVATVQPRKPKYEGIRAPWFVLAAKEQLLQDKSAETVPGGWKVTTTLDLKLQDVAEQEVKNGLAQIRRQKGDSAAFVAEDIETGQVVALVGGSDFYNEEYGQNNYATLRLPPGSSFKPYDYLSLIEHSENFGAGSVLYDTQGPLEGYPCTNKARPKDGGNCLQNFDFRYPGPLTLRYALGGSRNVPAVKAMLTVGVDKTIETAEKLGLESGYKCYTDESLTQEGQCYASSAIGDGAFLRLDEHVHSYGTISRNGVKIPQTYILKIEDASGKIVDEWQPESGEQVVRPDSAYIVADMMSDPNASYFTRKIHNYNGHKYSVKTGTTNDSKDGWLMGFSTKYAAGVWVGHHGRQIEMSGFMENMTQPIWKGWMDKAHANLEPVERPKPEGIQTLPAYVVRQHVGNGSVEPSPSNDIYPSWYKKTERKPGEKRVIDIVSNKLATDCTPARARKEVRESDPSSFSGDQFVSGQTSDNNARDDIHNCSDQKPGISVTSTPSNCSGNCTLTVNVTQGTHSISGGNFPGTIEVVIDGNVVGTFTIDVPGAHTVTFDSPSGGEKVVTLRIIDSVLYEATTTANVDFSSGETSSSITLAQPVVTGGPVLASKIKFNWSGGDGKVTIYKQPGGEVCNSNANSCESSYSAGQYYAMDRKGNRSNTVTVN